jgi:DNA-binding CsgD family transcriptional regulator
MSLTRREIQIISSVAEGNTQSETAKLLGINSLTVNTYLDRIREKLNASNTVHAVAIAVKQKIITL